MAFNFQFCYNRISKEKKMPFKKNWNQYKQGYGSIERQNYWIGLEKTHELTKSGDYGLELILEKDDGSVKTMNWDSFKVACENIGSK